MNTLIGFILAQAEQAPEVPAADGGNSTFIIVMLLMLAGMYFLIIAPQKKKQKEHQKLLNDLQAGTDIVTIGGIYGTIANVKEKTFIIKIADNTKIEILKGAVSSVVKEDAPKTEGK